MQTESHHLSGSASDLLEFPLSAEYLLNKGAKHARIEIKKAMSSEASAHICFLLYDGVGKPLHDVTHLYLMPQGLHCILVSPKACQDQLNIQQTLPLHLAPAEA